MEHIGNGDLDTRIELRQRTELGLLADTINDVTGRLKRSKLESEKKEQEIIDTQKEVIQTLGEVVESRSKETGNHILRVGKASYQLARLAGASESEAELIELASPMHDVGKVAVPDSILNKPGRLTKEEFDIIKSHTTIGYELLRSSDRPIMKAAAVIAHQHHEKWDGSGYPQGLKGEEIHTYGRVVALVDVFDALRSRRAYKDALPIEEVVQILQKDSGHHFDPRLVDVFLKHLSVFEEIFSRHQDEVPEEPADAPAKAA
ncbi:MAG: HD domain-containing protein [Acidimicrobiia bacterium]|nr:HD domain-containing protein [Acidimicrobiia bacterium]